MRGRQEILELYLKDKPQADDVDVKAIARGTPGFNGAGLFHVWCSVFETGRRLKNYNFPPKTTIEILVIYWARLRVIKLISILRLRKK